MELARIRLDLSGRDPCGVALRDRRHWEESPR
jgi:hypothetical protein